eukprot:31180-Pelagococcus_subviridis.AAC.13
MTSRARALSIPSHDFGIVTYTYAPTASGLSFNRFFPSATTQLVHGDCGYTDPQNHAGSPASEPKRTSQNGNCVHELCLRSACSTAATAALRCAPPPALLSASTRARRTSCASTSPTHLASTTAARTARAIAP